MTSEEKDKFLKKYKMPYLPWWYSSQKPLDTYHHELYGEHLSTWDVIL